MPSNCLNCMYSNQTGRTLRCRRRPPTPTEKLTIWPVVEAGDWCGEYVEDQEPEASEEENPLGGLLP
jgi:hypothetical protein